MNARAPWFLTMARRRDQKGGFSADIPSDAVEEALRSVEKARPVDEEESALELESPPAEPPPEEMTPEALASQVESLKAQLELSQEKARETLCKLKEEHERFLRAAADLEIRQ